LIFQIDRLVVNAVATWDLKLNKNQRKVNGEWKCQHAFFKQG